MKHFRGVYRDGAIYPTERVSLPEGTEVIRQAIGAAGPCAMDRFWTCASIDALAAQQGAQPIDRIEGLRAEWAIDEPTEELLAAVRAWRE